MPINNNDGRVAANTMLSVHCTIGSHLIMLGLSD